MHVLRRKAFYVSASLTVPSFVTFNIFAISLIFAFFDSTGWDTLSHWLHTISSSSGASFLMASIQLGHLLRLLYIQTSSLVSHTRLSINALDYWGKFGIFLFNELQSNLMLSWYWHRQTCLGVDDWRRTFAGLNALNLLSPILRSGCSTWKSANVSFNVHIKCRFWIFDFFWLSLTIT